MDFLNPLPSLESAFPSTIWVCDGTIWLAPHEFLDRRTHVPGYQPPINQTGNEFGVVLDNIYDYS